MADRQRLFGLKALVTGAAGGIGEAIARTFARHGAEVLAVDLPSTAIETQFEKVNGVVGLAMDITAENAPRELMAAVTRQMGTLDILVNNAGIRYAATVEKTSIKDWQRVMDVNLTAMFRLCQASIPLLKKSPAGRIINIGSVLSSYGQAGLSAHAASKHAVAGFTKSLASEVGGFGITANYIEPGAIMTEMMREVFRADVGARDFWIRKSAAGRLGEPIDVAKVALFLATDDAAFVSGQGIVVDGGATQSI